MDGDVAGFQQRQRELEQALAAGQNNLEQSKLRQKELAEEKRLFEESNAEVTASLCENEREAEAEHDQRSAELNSVVAVRTFAVDLCRASAENNHRARDAAEKGLQGTRRSRPFPRNTLKQRTASWPSMTRWPT